MGAAPFSEAAGARVSVRRDARVVGDVRRRRPGRGPVSRPGATRLGAACPELLPDAALAAPEVGESVGVALLASTLCTERGIRTTVAFTAFGRDRGTRTPDSPDQSPV